MGNQESRTKTWILIISKQTSITSTQLIVIMETVEIDFMQMDSMNVGQKYIFICGMVCPAACFCLWILCACLSWNLIKVFWVGGGGTQTLTLY